MGRKMIAIEAIDRGWKSKCCRKSRQSAMVDRSKRSIPSIIGSILVLHDTRIVMSTFGRIRGRIKNDLSVSELFFLHPVSRVI